MPAYDHIRIWEPEGIYFVTNRCIEEMYMMRPGGVQKEVQRICLACLAWAAQKHDVEVFSYVFMSNHFHLLVRALSQNLSEFMRDFQRELAARLNRHWGRTGTMFPRPFDAPKVIGEAEFLRRMTYIVNNPCHSNLVHHPKDWPGVSSWRSHVSGEAQVGRLIDYKELRRLRRKDESATREQAMRHDELHLAKPPMWEDKSDKEVNEKLVDLIEEEAKALQKERARRREKVVGPKKITQRNFRDRPRSPKRSPRVKCLSSDAQERRDYLSARRRTVDIQKRAMRKWRGKGKTRPKFPPGTFPPGWCRCVTA